MPVFLSSLLQVPLAQQVVGAGRVVGVLVALKKQLTEKHLTSVGITPGSNYVVAGAEDDGRCPEFDHLWVKPLQTDPPGASYEKTEREFVSVAVEFYRAHPTMGRNGAGVHRACSLSRAPSSGRSTSRSSAGGRSWTTPTQWQCTATTTVTSERRARLRRRR